MVKEYYSVSAKAGMATAALAIATGIFRNPYTLTAGLGTGINAEYAGLIASEMDKNNKGRGVKFEMTNILIFTVKPQ